MAIQRRIRTVVRGPLRSQLRQLQAASPWLAGRYAAAPDFVGIGVQRSGTSWWHSLIEAHPAVARLGWGAKELHFFDEFHSKEFTEADARRYHSHFLRRPGQVAGEWTPRYLHDPWVVPLLLQAAPSAKLLVMLRDPTARFVSGLRHAQKHFGTVTPDAVTEAFERGCYERQLARLLELAPRSQVLVLQFEQCVREPERLLKETFEFLELPTAPVSPSPSVNESVGTAPRIVETLLTEVRARYESEVVGTVRLFPDRIDPSLWLPFAGHPASS